MTKKCIIFSYVWFHKFQSISIAHKSNTSIVYLLYININVNGIFQEFLFNFAQTFLYNQTQSGIGGLFRQHLKMCSQNSIIICKVITYKYISKSHYCKIVQDIQWSLHFPENFGKSKWPFNLLCGLLWKSAGSNCSFMQTLCKLYNVRGSKF